MKWNRKFIVILIALFPNLVSALGLGSIDLDSGLNQPFEARIELLSITAEELNSIRVNLADAEAFRRANIERMFILGQLRFEIRETEDGPDYIRVYSQDPIREPYLHFLVEASWSNGRLYREYTVLLDPPLYDPNARQPAPTPSVAASTTPTRSFTPAISEPEETDSATFIPEFTGNEYGPINAGDTLWTIALQTRPDSSVSVQKMMLALQRANPEAFINGNINGLRRGQVLRIPELDEIDSTSQSAALDQVRNQNDLWQGASAAIADSASQRPISSTAEPSATMVDEPLLGEEDPELRLVAPEGGGVGTGGVDVNERSQLLDNEISLATEQLETITQENLELSDQVNEAESILIDLERLIELKDEELAALQQQFAESEIDEFADEEEIVEAEPVEEVIEEEVVEEEEISPTSVVTTQPVESTGMLDQVMKMVMDNIVVIGGGLAAIIVALIGLVFVKNRRGSSEQAAVSDFPDFSDEANVETEIGVEEDESEAETVVPAVDTAEDTGGEIEEAAAEEEGEHTVFAAPPATEETATEEPEEDALAEVNVFLAYEHFDQAEEFVRDAIQGDPENLEFHSKLLEVFYASGNKPAYEEEARVLNDLVNGEGAHWDMATAMWQEMSPNRALFEEPVEGEEESPAVDAAEAGGGMLDLTAEEGEEPAPDDEASVDFDIGGDSVADAGGAEEQLEASSGSADEDILDVTSAVETSDSGEDLLDVTAAVGIGEAVEEPVENEQEEEAVLDITANEDEEEVLDLTAGSDEEVLDMTSTDIKEEEEVLDVTSGEDDAVLDVTSGEDTSANSEDLLDVSAVSGDDLLDVTAHTALEEGDVEEDLLDVTSATSAGVDASGLLGVEDDELDIAEEDIGDSTVEMDDLDIAEGSGDVAESDSDIGLDIDSSADDDVLDLTMGDDDSSTDSETDSDIELDLSAEDSEADDLSLEIDETAEDDSVSDGLEIDLSIDDTESEDKSDSDFSLELNEDAAEEADLDLSISDDEEVKPAQEEELTLDTSGVPELSLDDEPESNTELDMESTVEMPKNALNLDEDDDDEDDDEDHTVFVPRSGNAEEQSEEDEIATKLDLAKAYVELGDKDSAKNILGEVISEGNEEQKKQAQELLDQV